MDIDAPDKVAEIRRLNDEFRTTFQGGKIVLTAGVAALPDMVKAAALHQVSCFTAFTERNDPLKEHDFVNFHLCNRDFYFKISYYAPDMEHGSEDPGDPKQTVRIGTLMFASEW